MDTILDTLSQSHIEKAAKEAGVTLTKEQSRAISQAEREYLRENKRVSFGNSASTLLIREFADSPFLVYEDSAETLLKLTEAFYELREDFPASITDIEIIESLRAAFDSDASGEPGLATSITRESLIKRTNDSAYEIADENGRVYHWDPEEWHDDITADGWFGERWEEDDE